MLRIRLALSTSIAAGAVVLATASPALAFHHVALPAAKCGQSDHAGGANPAATLALREHNPAQTLPLPPVGLEHAPVDRGNCAGVRD